MHSTGTFEFIQNSNVSILSLCKKHPFIAKEILKHKNIDVNLQATDKKWSIFFRVNCYAFPKGAVYYLRNMHTCKKFGRGLAQRFVQENHGYVRFTISHKHHIHTEYRYIMKENGEIIAMEKNHKTNEFDIFFTGHYTKFCNRYGDQNTIYKLRED